MTRDLHSSTNDAPSPWVRRANRADLDALVRLVSMMHDEEPPLRSGTGAHAAVLASILAQTDRFLPVGGISDEVVATADMVVVTNLSRGARPWAVVENVVVDPNSRRRGLARLLMLELIDIAKERGCYKMQLVSAARRQEAHALYEALNFDASVRGFRRYIDDTDLGR